MKLYPLRLRFAAQRDVSFGAGVANIVRGQLGKVLWRKYPADYARYFAPVKEGGPSGFRNPPRPFVLRAAHLEGSRVKRGDHFELGLNLFETRDSPVDLFTSVLSELAAGTWEGPLETASAELLSLPLIPDERIRDRSRATLRFVTPTELKGAPHPEFPALFARIRDRVSQLRSHYGDGPLEIDFRAMGERAEAIRMTRCELIHHRAQRQSRATGQTHPLSGFTGIAEYEGDLCEFLPYLEAARWTGVGRQTVWGKGELHLLADAGV